MLTTLQWRALGAGLAVYVACLLAMNGWRSLFGSMSADASLGMLLLGGMALLTAGQLLAAGFVAGRFAGRQGLLHGAVGAQAGGLVLLGLSLWRFADAPADVDGPTRFVFGLGVVSNAVTGWIGTLWRRG